MLRALLVVLACAIVYPARALPLCARHRAAGGPVCSSALVQSRV